jgi:hypothetical protein
MFRINELRPNNWYLDRRAVDGLRAVWRRGDQHSLPPVLVARIDGVLSLIDGHARTFVAVENSETEIAAVEEELASIEGSSALYEHIHRESERLGILTIGDLRERILEPADYERKWVGYCEAWLARNRETSEE